MIMEKTRNEAIVIAIMNQKGGSGKTTAARNIGYALQEKGKRVILFDTDPQGSLRIWSDNSSGEVMRVIGVDKKGTLKSYINDFKVNYDYIIIDTRPSISNDDKTLIPPPEIIKEADLVLVSVLPSEDDVKRSLPVLDLIEISQEMTGKPSVYFLLGRFRAAHETAKATIKYIESLDRGIPYIETPISDKQTYVKSYSSGTTILHSSNSSDKKEIENMNKIADKLIEVTDGI
jgi:chromosome partitioning protein